MKNITDILDFNSSDEYNDIEISKILDYYNIDRNELLKKAFESLEYYIEQLSSIYDEYVARRIYKCIKLIDYICSNEIFNDKAIRFYKEKIKISREEILIYANDYSSPLLYKCASNLDEIVLSKLITVINLVNLTIELINKNEDVDIIKKIIDVNKEIITYNDGYIFDYIFNLAYNAIKNKDRNIYYYITLLKIFYYSKADTKKYINKLIELDELNDKDEEVFIQEIVCLLFGNKRALRSSDILSKYELTNLLIDDEINIINRNIDTDETIITIDSDNTFLREDGLSIKKDGNNYIVGIHISDIGLSMEPGSFLDDQAKSNLKCIYLAKGVRILPDNVEKEFSLKEKNKRNLISLYVVLSNTGEIIDYYLKENTTIIAKNFDYTYCDRIIRNTSKKGFNYMIRELFEISCILHEKNKDKINYWEKKEETKSKDYDRHINKSDQINSEFIVLYNSLLGKIAKEREFPFIYRYQEKEYISSLAGSLGIVLDKETSKIIENIYLNSKYSSVPRCHDGLGIDFYAQCSNPGRKYPDLYNQYLLHKFYFNDKDFYFDDESFKMLIDYINQRSAELKLMRSEYSREIRLERRIKTL